LRYETKQQRLGDDSDGSIGLNNYDRDYQALSYLWYMKNKPLDPKEQAKKDADFAEFLKGEMERARLKLADWKKDVV